MVVTAEDTKQLAAIKARHHIPEQLQSCHTAIVDGYVIEGHVPSEQIIRLLREKPDIIGLSVPGMPLGSPGMEMDDGTVEAYDVIAFDKQGGSRVYASYPKQ